MEWRLPSSSRQKKIHILQQSGNHSQRIRSTTLGSEYGILHGSTVTFREFIERRQFQERGSWLPLHDNVRPHTAVSVKQFLAKQAIPE
jgi:hypothetical protein